MTDPSQTPSKPDTGRSDARRTVRVAMQEYLRRDSVLPVLWMLLDLAFLGACIVGACYFDAWWAKALMVVPASVAIARLFVIGHDACHGSYTKYDWLNKIVGRIAFLPSLTPFSLWDVGHNVAHHGFTNLKGRDQVWVPMSARAGCRAGVCRGRRRIPPAERPLHGHPLGRRPGRDQHKRRQQLRQSLQVH